MAYINLRNLNRFFANDIMNNFEAMLSGTATFTSGRFNSITVTGTAVIASLTVSGTAVIASLTVSGTAGLASANVTATLTAAKFLVQNNTSGEFFRLQQLDSFGSYVALMPYNGINGAILFTNWASGNGALHFGSGNATPKVSLLSNGQLGVGTQTPHSAALVDISTTTQGVLLPRLTSTQRDAISSSTAGLFIYNTTTGKLNIRGAAAWESISSL